MPITGKVVCAAAAPRQMGRHACRANEYTEPLFPGSGAKFLCLGRGPVCRIYVYLIGYAKIAQSVQRFANDGHIAVAAH